MAKKGQKFKNYSNKLKLKVVKSYLNAEGSYLTLFKKYIYQASI